MNRNSLIIAIGIFFTSLFSIANTAQAASNSTLDFDGSSDYVAAADNAVLDQANSLSLSVWIEPDDAPAGDEYILYRYNNYYLKINSSRQIVGSVNTDSARVTSAKTITADGAAWTHIELAYNKDAGGTDEIKLYINGVLDSVGDYSTAITASDKKLYIGAGDIAGDNTPENWFDGQIDNPALYQYARSAADILLDYNNGLAVFLGPTLKTCSEDPASCMDYGLVGNWPFNEGSGQKAYDMSDSKNNGRLGSSASADTADPKWTKGKNSGGLKFDGVDDYVDAGNKFDIAFNAPQTYEAWIRTTQTSYGTIMSKSDADTPWQGWWLTIDGGITNGIRYDYLAVINSNHLRNRWQNVPYSDEKWHHLVIVKGDNTVAKLFLYLDGVKQTDVYSSVNTLSTSVTTSIPCQIGYRDTSVYPFKGTIDEVRIYNRALSAEEVRYHYNRGGPVAEWKFDEGSGTKAFDSTENNNNGALVGATHLPTWTAGKYGSALSFDGTEDYVQVTDTANLRFDASTLDYSLFAWTKRTTTGIEYIISKEDADNDGWRLMFNSGNQVVCSEDSTDITSTSTITDINWHHIGCAIDRDGNGQIYIDGRADGSAVSMGTDAMATTANIRIGTRSYTSANFFNGAIDEVRIYNYARTAQQVKTEYNGGAVNFR